MRSGLEFLDKNVHLGAAEGCHQELAESLRMELQDVPWLLPELKASTDLHLLVSPHGDHTISLKLHNFFSKADLATIFAGPHRRWRARTPLDGGSAGFSSDGMYPNFRRQSPANWYAAPMHTQRLKQPAEDLPFL